MSLGSFLMFEDMMVPAPSKDAVMWRGWEIVEGAYRHAIWSERWRALVGRSWEAWQGERQERKRSNALAELDVTLDPSTARVTTARTTAGLLPLTSFDTHSAVDDEPPTVTMTMPMRNVRVTTSVRRR